MKLPLLSKLSTSREGTAGAPLVYWLLVVCGLVGLTIMRLDNPAEVIPVWLGTLSGVALGQLLAWQRIRGWIPAVVAICGLWFAPVLYFVLYDAFGMEAEVATLSFVPAAVCGYISLSERGALVSFWYPAVLWMLAIVDGSSTTSITVSTGLPLAIGLAVLFIAFLRARESRRVALWRKYASEKLAHPVKPTVLRSSPIRSASQMLYTGVVGISALVLAAWIGPHLWKLEQQKEQKLREVAAANAAAANPSYTYTPRAEEPCCWDEAIVIEEKKVKVKEYLPLSRAQREREIIASAPASPTSCRACGGAGSTYCGMGFSGYSAQPWGWGDGPYAGNGYGVAWNGNGYGGAGYDPYSIGGHWTNGVYPQNIAPEYIPPTNHPVNPVNPPVHTTPAKKQPPKHPKTPATTLPPPPPPPATTTPDPTPPAPEVAEPAPASKVAVTPVKAPPRDMTSPWQWTLGICLTGLALHLLLRAVRRTVLLRHLQRPFWNETLDQRVSNHWQRMLIGLGDAGIHPSRDELPQAFARRVGIAGMEVCAAILERVRHGVRLEDGDLETMDAAASDVYRSARKRAGSLGRLTAWIRSPLVEH